MRRFLCLIVGLGFLHQMLASETGQSTGGWQSSKTPSVKDQVPLANKLKADALKLKMISGTAQRRMATINDETFLAGETHAVTRGNTKVLVECLEVREQSALVKVEGESALRELKLNDIPQGSFDSVVSQATEFADHNFALTLPYGWHSLPEIIGQKNIVAAYSSPDEMAKLVVRVEETFGTATIDDEFVARFEKGFQAAGGMKPLSARFVEIDGIKGYERVGEQSVDDRNIRMMTLLVAVGGRNYSMTALRLNGDVDADPEIRSCFSSFRFIATPTGTRSRFLEQPVAYRVGYGVGSLAMIGVFVVVLRAVIRS